LGEGGSIRSPIAGHGHRVYHRVLRLRPYRSYESVDGVAVADGPEHALVAGFWQCVEIIGGVGIGLALTAIPFPGE